MGLVFSYLDFGLEMLFALYKGRSNSCMVYFVRPTREFDIDGFVWDPTSIYTADLQPMVLRGAACLVPVGNLIVPAVGWVAGYKVQSYGCSIFGVEQTWLQILGRPGVTEVTVSV